MTQKSAWSKPFLIRTKMTVDFFLLLGLFILFLCCCCFGTFHLHIRLWSLGLPFAMTNKHPMRINKLSSGPLIASFVSAMPNQVFIVWMGVIFAFACVLWKSSIVFVVLKWILITLIACLLIYWLSDLKMISSVYYILFTYSKAINVQKKH